MLRYWFDLGYYVLIEGEKSDVIKIENDEENYDQSSRDETLINFQDLEKLYKRFDIKSIKDNMWEVFKDIDINVYQKLIKDEKDFYKILKEYEIKQPDQANFPVSTLFVCLLHLAAEKSNKIIN